MAVVASTPSTSVLLVRSGERACAIPLSAVREILRPQPLQPFDGTLPCLEGLCVLRGEPAPVVNLARLLGGGSGSGSPPPSTRLVALKAGTRSVALAVGSVEGIRSLDARELLELPPLLAAEADGDGEGGEEGAGGGEGGQIAHVARLDGELALVLRATRLVPDSIWAALQAQAAAREPEGEEGERR